MDNRRKRPFLLALVMILGLAAMCFGLTGCGGDGSDSGDGGSEATPEPQAEEKGISEEEKALFQANPYFALEEDKYLNGMYLGQTYPEFAGDFQSQIASETEIITEESIMGGMVSSFTVTLTGGTEVFFENYTDDVKESFFLSAVTTADETMCLNRGIHTGVSLDAVKDVIPEIGEFDYYVGDNYLGTYQGYTFRLSEVPNLTASMFQGMGDNEIMLTAVSESDCLKLLAGILGSGYAPYHLMLQFDGNDVLTKISYQVISS